MKSFPLTALLFFFAAAHAGAQLDAVLDDNEGGWVYLHPLDGTDPATSGSDPDFQSTWYHQDLTPYTGGTYDGPAFSAPATAPFVYDTVTEISPGTVLTTPASGNRYTSYFLKTIDGGANGYHSLEIDALADDGLFVYLNGVLIARDNTSGADTYTKLSNTGGIENVWEPVGVIGTPTLNAGPNLLAVSVHNSSSTSSDLGFAIRMRGIDASNPVPTTLLSPTATGWAYLQNLSGTTGVDPESTDADFDTTWFDQSLGAYTGGATYNGPAFTTGASAPFQYDNVTGISANTGLTKPDSGTRYTTYFLCEIDGGVTGYSNLDLTMLADDGAYIYLNGNLIASRAVPAAGPDSWETLATSTANEVNYFNLPVNPATVVLPGPNLLAVSVHQRSNSSSDSGLRLQLTGTAGLPDLYDLNVTALTFNSATVSWKTTTAGNSNVDYGLSPGSLGSNENLPGSRTTHSINLTGLTQNTTYYFEASTDDGVSFNPSATGSFTTPLDPSAINLTRGPYLQSLSHDRATFRWRTNLPGNSTVRYGSAPGSLTMSSTIPGSTTEHTVTLTGLPASTTYYYQVETDNGIGGVGTSTASIDYFFTTGPAPGVPTPTRIWVIGDSGTADSNAAGVYNAFRTFNGQDHTNLWLMLGDNAYNDGSDTEYQNAVYDMYPELLRNTPLWPAFGNHDSQTSGGAPYLAMFNLPTAGECGGVASGTELYYSFDHGNIHFICLDSQTSANVNDVLGGTFGMADWLQADLEATTADWIIAYFHHGPYTKGSHDSDTESRHIAIRANTLPILEDYGVDLILSGHSHCYERSHLIDGHYGLSTSYSSGTHAVDTGNGSDVGSINGAGSFVLSGADGAYQKPLAAGRVGQVSSIVGSSGKLSNWDDGTSALVNPTPHPVFIANLRLLGSMVVDISGDTMHAVFLDDSGAVRDDFSIVKGSTLTAAPTDSTMTEGAPDNTATITVSRTGATDLPLTVDYNIGGSAGAADYTPALSGTLSFAIGETSKPLNLTVAADANAEGPETILLTLIPRTARITPSSADRDTYFLGTPDDATIALGDLPSQSWYFAHFGPTLLTPALWTIDHDNDHLDALREYALGGDPNLTDDSALAPALVTTPTTLELHYTKDNSKTDLHYRVLTSTNLSLWTPTGVTDTIDGAPNPTGPEAHKATIPITGSPAFLTLEITLP